MYNLTGSTIYAELRKDFVWTCEMFLPPNRTINVVIFKRNGTKCVTIGFNNGNCGTEIVNTRYAYRCDHPRYKLTIPAENMTEYEQNSVWSCYYAGDGSFRSPNKTLKIASKN